MGDLVIRKNEPCKMMFKVTEFSGNQVILKGYSIPIITIDNKENLIKLNRERINENCLRRIK